MLTTDTTFLQNRAGQTLPKSLRNKSPYSLTGVFFPSDDGLSDSFLRSTFFPIEDRSAQEIIEGDLIEKAKFESVPEIRELFLEVASDFERWEPFLSPQISSWNAGLITDAELAQAVRSALVRKIEE